MRTESTIDGEGGVVNPFINAQIEIKLDELLAPETREILEAGGSGVKVTISQETLRRLQIVAWDSGSPARLLAADRAVLAVIEALGLTIRADETDESE